MKRATAVTPTTARTVFCLWLAPGGLDAKSVGPDEITVFRVARECAVLLDRSSLVSLLPVYEVEPVACHKPTIRGKGPLAHHPSGMMSSQIRRRTTSPAAGVNRRADWCLLADRGHAEPGREDGVPPRPARRRSVAWPGARAARPDPAGDRAGSFRPAPRRR
jgi:hypothetical protein